MRIKNLLPVLFFLIFFPFYSTLGFSAKYNIKNHVSVALVKSNITAKYMPNQGFYLQEVDYAHKALSLLGLKVTVITDQELETGSFLNNNFSLLVLPNVKNMSQKTVLNIQNFAKNKNGKILAFQMTSYRSEVDEAANIKQGSHVQNNFQLADLFGADFLRWSSNPPACQFLMTTNRSREKSSLPTWNGLPNKIELGRNMAMLVKPHQSSEILAIWGDAPYGNTSNLPGNLGTAVLANHNKTCIYSGENLLVPENFSSIEVRRFLANIIQYLLPSIKLNPEKTVPGIWKDFPIHKYEPIPFGKKIRIGISIPLSTVSVTASSPFYLLSGNEKQATFLPKGSLIKISLYEEKLRCTVQHKNKTKYYTYNTLILRPLSPNAIISYIDFRKNGTYQIKHFRGEFHLQPFKNSFPQAPTGIQIINVVDINHYLLGVVPHEVPFHFPNEALKAMSIVARTFALNSLKRHKDDGYDLCNTVHCQTYDGISYEAPPSTLAVSDTKTATIFFNEKLAPVTYHSTCGGVTEDISNVWDTKPSPFLRSIYDAQASNHSDLTSDEAVNAFLSEDTNSYCRLSSRYRWEETYTQKELETLFNESLPVILKHPINQFHILDIKVMERTPSGRVKQLLIETDNGKYTIPQEKVRWLFNNGKIGLSGLQSTLFVIKKESTDNGNFAIHIIGGGWGHGVGMCQFGARGMAKTGADYKEILTHYFPGITISPYYKSGHSPFY